MWDRVTIKHRGKQAFLSNYWTCVGIAFVYTLLFGGSGAVTSSMQATTSAPAASVQLSDEQAIVLGVALMGIILVSMTVSLLVKIFLTNPVEVGVARFFKSNLERADSGFATLAEGFSDYGHVFVTLLLRGLFVLLWSLLLIVPGIIKSYSYRLVPYIVKDEPGLSPLETLRRSEELMRNNRWKAFVLDLSFLGWAILGVLTLGLGLVFWTNPYMHSTNAALYEELRRG